MRNVEAPYHFLTNEGGSFSENKGWGGAPPPPKTKDMCLFFLFLFSFVLLLYSQSTAAPCKTASELRNLSSMSEQSP